MIPEEIIAEVRDRAEIVEVVGEYVTLKRRGSDYWAPCPFHQEKTPSFHVVPGREFFKCFGCGEAGDVFSFLMKHAGLSFQEAVRHLADRVGVEIPDPRARREEEDPHRALREATAFAADLYRRSLWDETVGANARRYLEGRGIGREAAERFELGYVPDSWRTLREAAARHGIDDETLLEAGLVNVSEKAAEPYDRFRNRIIFPITDVSGRTVGFGGRLLGREGRGAPKYLNSPETPIYHKGRTLYGLSWAKAAIRRERSVLVVEGYTDYVSLAAHGVENVIAVLGTAMTVEQAELIARFTKQALLLFDSDSAGLRATFRTADALLSVGVHPLVVSLPPGEDPDSVVRGGGADALKRYLNGAVDVLDRKLSILEERGYFRGAEGTRKALDGVLPTLRATRDAALRDIYLARITERTGVRRETLEAEMAKMPAPVLDRAASGSAVRPPSREVRGVDAAPGAARPPAKAPGLAAQQKLLLLLLRDAGRIEAAAEALSAEEFTDPVSRELFEELVRKDGMRDGDPLSLELSASARDRLEALLADPVELTDADRIFDDTVRKIRLEPLFARLAVVKTELERARDAGDEDGLREAMRERYEIARSLNEHGSFFDSLLRKRL